VEFDYDQGKDEVLYRQRGVSFIDAISAISSKGVLRDFEHPNQSKYPGQRVFVVEIHGYAYCIPYEARGETYFLKTLYPSRKFKHLIKGGKS
jgi:hypothetical protein